MRTGKSEKDKIQWVCGRLEFIERLRKYILAQGLSSQSFDPGSRPEHGAGKLYPLISEASGHESVCLVTSLPRIQDASTPDILFLEYIKADPEHELGRALDLSSNLPEAFHHSEKHVK
ncbi:MAG: hypothetical protein GY862_17510 [Gammaproteobacteria bacterium]|nr:hypothetical protein [Gammaproteobacteria bacterium]